MMMRTVEPEVVADTAQAVADPFAMLLIVVGIIVVCLAAVAYREAASSALALIGVFGGAVITLYQIQTFKEYWGWALVSTLVALGLFAWDLFSAKQKWVTSWLAAVIGIFGSLLSMLLQWNVDVDVNAENIPLGWIVVIVVIVLALFSLGNYRRRRANRVVTTTTTAP